MPRGGTKGGVGASTALSRHITDIQVSSDGSWVRDHRFRFATFAEVLATVEVDPLRVARRHDVGEDTREGHLPGQAETQVDDE